MTFELSLLLAQDGLNNGAIYALLALALVMVFTITRAIFVPQGDFVAFGALTLAELSLNRVPGTVWLLLAAGATAFAVEAYTSLRQGQIRRICYAFLLYCVAPVAIAALTIWAAPQKLALPLLVILTLCLVVPLGPMLYRVVYQPIADASVLVLLIVSTAVHFFLTGCALVFFGAEGSRTPPFTDARFSAGGILISGQVICVIVASAALIAGLYWAFRNTMYGKALLATAVNRVGARLMGISTTMTGMFAFSLAAVIGCFSGILIGSVTTIYYDTGFIIALKGFVAAIMGGLVSYPLAAVGALLVGLLESYASFAASAFKEVIVFSLILPVLLWRSLTTLHVEEDEE